MHTPITRTHILAALRGLGYKKIKSATSQPFLHGIWARSHGPLDICSGHEQIQAKRAEIIAVLRGLGICIASDSYDWKSIAVNEGTPKQYAIAFGASVVRRNADYSDTYFMFNLRVGQ